jgi:hypothetical protein
MDGMVPFGEEHRDNLSSIWFPSSRAAQNRQKRMKLFCLLQYLPCVFNSLVYCLL